MIEGAPARQRLDRWLWFARLVKSRTRAAALVEEGHVRLNKLRVTEPSQPLKRGDVLTIAIAGSVRVWRVEGLGSRRGPAPEARALYTDLLVNEEARSERPLEAG